MTEQDDLYDFDLFNFDTGPSAEEIAAEQERQEIMWTSYVKEMLSVLTVYVQAKEEDSKDAADHNDASISTQPAFTLNELLDTVLEILSEHVSSRAADRDVSTDDSESESENGVGSDVGSGGGSGGGSGHARK